MNKKGSNKNTPLQKPGIFDFIAEAFGWMQIALSLFAVACLMGIVIYILKRDTVGLVIAIAVAGAGLVTGIMAASKAWKSKGTISLISRISASPELDKPEEE